MGLSPSSAFLVPAGTSDTANSQQIGSTAPKAASVWRAQTLSQALDDVLFPATEAVYVQPTLTLSAQTPSQLIVERGASWNNAGNPFTPVWTPNDAGSATSHSWIKDTTVLPSVTGAPTARSNFSEASVTVEIKYRVRANYTSGPQKLNGKGQPSGTPIPSGSITSSDEFALKVTPILPYYYIKSPISFTREQFTAAIAAGNANNIAGATLTKVVASSAGTITIPYDLNNQFFGVAYPGAAKANYFITTFDSGLLTAVFSARTTASTSGQNNIWTNETFNYHLTPGPITNSNANIQIS